MAKIKNKITYLLALVAGFSGTSIAQEYDEPKSGENAAESASWIT